MKLNPDCIRDILLAVEKVTDANTPFRYSRYKSAHQHLAKYDHNEILYHMKQCNMDDMFDGFTLTDSGDLVIIRDLSPKGHKFLANVRQDNIWNNTKIIAGKVGSKSLEALVQISSNIITDLVKAQFGLS